MTRHLLNKLPFACSTLAAFLGLTITVHGGSIPSIEVTVFSSNGKVAFKRPINNANATFATGNLSPGDYVVQFNSRSVALKKNQYLLVVSAGKKKVIAAAVPEQQFTGGGAAMKIHVGPGTNITGQVVDERTIAQGNRSNKYRIIDGKRYVFVPSELGSNIGGKWVQEGLAPTRNVVSWNRDEIQKRMDRGGEGSMIPYTENYGQMKSF